MKLGPGFISALGLAPLALAVWLSLPWREAPAVTPRGLRPSEVRLAQLFPTSTAAPAPTATRVRPTPEAANQAPAGSSTGSNLPPALQPLPWSRPPAELAARATATVTRQLEPYPGLVRYQDRARRAEARVQFLQPFEFLIWVWLDRQPELRDRLLATYQRDQRAALAEASRADIWPSPRAELLLDLPAQFDADEDLILINLGATGEAEAHQVLVHELWHATPDLRAGQNGDGEHILTTGFWSERWDRRHGVWIPIDDPRGLIFEPWLLDEAMAFRLERAGTEREPLSHERIHQAAEFLDRVEELLGPERLLTLYLTSDDDGFMEDVRARRAVLARYFSEPDPVGRRAD